MDAVRFIELTQKHAAVDYGSMQSVRTTRLVADELWAATLAALSNAQ
jgi:hypothetical protein